MTNIDRVLLKINVLPAQSAYLAAAQSVKRRYANNILDRGTLECLKQLVQLACRIGLRLIRNDFRRSNSAYRIIHQSAVLDGLVEHTFQQHDVLFDRIPGEGLSAPLLQGIEITLNERRCNLLYGDISRAEERVCVAQDMFVPLKRRLGDSRCLAEFPLLHQVGEQHVRH